MAENRLNVRFHGVRGSIPTPQASHLRTGGNTSCVEVWSGDASHCILDLGTGAYPLGKQLVADNRKDLTVFLSHFHWDHIQGFPFFAPLFDPETSIKIFAHNRDGDPKAILEQQMEVPNFPIGFDYLPANIDIQPTPEERIAVGELEIEPFLVHHTQSVHGFQIHAGSTRIVYCTDYEHGNATRDAQLFDLVSGADLLICDAQYTPEEYVTRKGWGHSTWAHAAELARQAHVGSLALFHHDPDHDDGFLSDVLKKAQEVFPGTILAIEGETLTL